MRRLLALRPTVCKFDVRAVLQHRAIILAFLSFLPVDELACRFAELCSSLRFGSERSDPRRLEAGLPFGGSMMVALSRFFASGGDSLAALPATYNYFLVFLSYLIAALGSYAFLQFAGRIAELHSSASRFGWLAGGAVAMGGGVWAMHFVGMLAYRLPIPVSYDPWVTVSSMVPAMLAAAIALHVVARATVSTPRVLIGGALMGAGIGAMHYTGMAALRLDALVRYDPSLFVTSVIVAVILAILVLQVRFWVGTVRISWFAKNKELLGALILGFAVAAMHYTAMASTYCLAVGGRVSRETELDPSTVAIVVAFITSLVLLIAINAVISTAGWRGKPPCDRPRSKASGR
ncbi:MAG: hypothetical protein JOY81_09360 [Alphaproteobacteria bacterium]|nr:hypothetical protein [Alphaproteobacteria bacterium]